MTQGWNRTGHISFSPGKRGRNLTHTVRPNRVAAQASEPGIPAKNIRQRLTIALIAQPFWRAGTGR
jgi:hypothetical protein